MVDNITVPQEVANALNLLMGFAKTGIAGLEKHSHVDPAIIAAMHGGVSTAHDVIACACAVPVAATPPQVPA